MDFPLNSSLILAVTVGLWLLWVGPYVFRRSGMSAAPAAAGMPAPPSTVIRSSISADGLSQQGNLMYNVSTRPGNVTGAPAPSAGTAQVRPGQPEFRIRWGRTGLALAGALALAAVVVGLPLAAFGAASWWLPAGALAAGAAAIAALRALAVRARRDRVDAAFRAAMSAGRPAAPQPAVPAVPAAEPVRHRETVLFDAQSTPGAGLPAAAPTAEAASVTTAPGAPDRRLTAAELRSAALDVAAKAAPAGPPKISTTPWEPVEIPKPTYVEAPVAQRPAPEPLVLPESPKPSARTSLRPPAAAAGEGTGPGAAAPSTGKINLDDVLQRRRA